MAHLDARDPTGQAWSVSRLLFGLGDLLDVEGRPLGERRATSGAKRGCPMELAPCPYPDERQGIAMNVSALTQVKRYLGEVHADVARFHASLADDTPAWTRMFLAVLDQALAPAHFVLREGADAALPGAAATGHKLAAGLFAVVSRIAVDQARDVSLAPNIDALMEHIHGTRALIGGGGHEVCAGPAKLIRRTTAVFLGACPPAVGRVPSQRVQVARALHTQLRLALVLELFENAAEHELLTLLEGQMLPRNPFIRSKLETRMEQLSGEPMPLDAARLMDALPRGVDAELERRVARALARFGNEHALPAFEIEPVLLQVLAEGRGALQLHGSPPLPALARLVACVLHVRGEVYRGLCRLEGHMREALGHVSDMPFRFSSLVLPSSRSLPWFTALSGTQPALQHASTTVVCLHTPGRGTRTLTLI